MDIKFFTELTESEKRAVFDRYCQGFWDGNVNAATIAFRTANKPENRIFCAMHENKCAGLFWCAEDSGKIIGEYAIVSHPKKLVRAGVDVAAELMKALDTYVKRNSLKLKYLLPTPEFNRMASRVGRIQTRQKAKLRVRKKITPNIRH